METLESAVVSFADMSKIKANLWSLTCETQHVDDLCERMGHLFTTHEKSWMVKSIIPLEHKKYNH